jgi:hypothetical protein
MAKKRRGKSKRATVRRKKSAVKRRPAPRARVRRVKKTAGKRTTSRRRVGDKAAGRKAPSIRPRRAQGARRLLDAEASAAATTSSTRGLGPEAGGQSGDTEGLSIAELADSESVEELLEEGQAFEAGIVSGVENAPDADKGGVRTRQVPEDDVPQEYLDED